MGETSAASRLGTSCWMIAAGGICLGLQRQATGELVGTGYRSLGVGALVAVVALVFTFLTAGRGGLEPRVPRDGLSGLSSVCGFAGVTFLISAVLLPGGTWMFVEALVLVLFLSRNDGGRVDVSLASGPALRQGTLFLFALFLLLRLWVTWQGAHHRWAAVEVEIPVLSLLPFLPERMVKLELGEFSAEEFGIPWVGLDFDVTVALWAAGFALVAGGLWLRHKSAYEYENDRIQATIEGLPPALAILVQRVLPEEEWDELGLHGLGERHRRKRIAALTEERVRSAVDFHQLYVATALPPAPESEFGRAVTDSFRRYRELAALPAAGGGPRSRAADAGIADAEIADAEIEDAGIEDAGEDGR